MTDAVDATQVGSRDLLEIWRERCQITDGQQQEWMNSWLGMGPESLEAPGGGEISDHPQFKPMMVEFLKEAIKTLYKVWKFPEPTKGIKKALERIDKRKPELKDLSEIYFKEFAFLLWEHPDLLLKFRALFDDKMDIISTLKTAQPWDVDAVWSDIYGSQDNDGIKRRVASALNNLGHFTSKPTHTAAAVIGIILPSGHRAVGPYLTSGQLMQCGDSLPLDKILNSGALVGTVLKVLNDHSDGGDPVMAQSIRVTTDELLRDGVAPKKYNIDPRLKQLLLPVDGAASEYLSVTPLTSMGLSACIHSRIVLKNSFAKRMSYGYSTTALTNFTAILKAQSAVEEDLVVTDIPNRVLMFNVPMVNLEFVTLKRVQKKGFLPFITQSMLGDIYQAREGNNYQRKMEKSKLEGVIKSVLKQIGGIKKECEAALEKPVKGMDSLPALAGSKSVIREFLLCDRLEDKKPVFDKLFDAIAECCYAALDAARFNVESRKDISLGLSLKDKEWFMSWAPDFINEHNTLIWG